MRLFTKLVLWMLCSACLLASALCFWIFYSEYWAYRHVFDAQGRYFDAANLVVHDSASAFFAIPAVLFLLTAVALVAVFFRYFRYRKT